MQPKLLVLSTIILASLLITPAQGDFQLAQTDGLILDPIDIKATMNTDGTTLIEIHARATNFGSSAISSLNYRIDSLEVTVVQTLVNDTITSSTAVTLERYTEILIPFPQSLDVNESIWIDLTLQSTDLQYQQIDEFSFDSTRLHSEFTFYLSPSVELANFTLTAVLPQDAMLSRESVVPLFPEANSNFTDGESLGFIWFIQSIQPGQIRVFTIRYQTPNDSAVSIQSDPLSLIIIAVFGIIVGVVLTLGGPKFYQRIRRIGSVRFV